MTASLETVPLADGQIDIGQQKLVRADRVVHLTTREVEVMRYLSSRPGQTVTREELLVEVWGHPRFASTEPVYSTIKRLRAKIEGPSHRHIVTVHGDGYRFEPAPATKAIAAAPPRVKTRFVGRVAELAQIDAAFASGARLVTLLGPGGVGKTRTAREIERRRGAVFVDLAEARTAEDALRTVATALDVPLDGASVERWSRGLGRALAAKPAGLIILDNAEQIVAGLAPHVARWLDESASPLLVTSREPLAVSGEHLVQLDPLTPDEAVELFVDRARAAQFDATGVLGDVRALVDELDRLPLAIELAAARVRLFRPDALLGRLRMRHGAQLDELGRAPRDLPTRHATLREAVAWSWQLSSATERKVLATLSVFAGGFTVEAAEAVTREPDVVDVIASLRDRSLLRVRADGRFEPYLAVQALAAEHLADDDARAAEDRHASWIADDAEGWLADLDGRGHTRARAHLESELDNVRVAFERVLGRDAALVARLARVLDACLRLRGGPSERRDVLARALGVIAGVDERAELALALGEALAEIGDAGADVWLHEARASASTAALAEAALGANAASHGDFAAGVALLKGAVERAAAVGARTVEGRALTTLGEVSWRAGRATDARVALERAWSIHLETGDLRAQARTAATLCHAQRAEGRPAQALELLDHADRCADALGDQVLQARLLIDRGLHLSRVGRQSDAIAALERAGEGLTRAGVLRGQEEVHLNLAEALMGLGNHRRARAEVHAAVAVCRELGERLRLSTALELLACAALLEDDLAAAEGALAEAREIAKSSGNQRSEATILAKRGFCHYLRSQWQAALDDFAASAALHHERGASAMEGTSLADVAVTQAALGLPYEATAQKARELLGNPPETTWMGRMLTLLEAASAAHSSAEGKRRADSIRKEVLSRMPADAQDLATRLSSLMLAHAAR